jgi:XTP/dITP diphosphohydrolase
MKLVLASQNKKKIKELQDILSALLPDVQVLSLADIGIVEDIEENGTTFEENALIKAKVAAAAGYIGVGDDSGLCVQALDGAPGIFSARYAGEHGDDEANTALLLQNMENVTDRRAAFRCVIACAFPDGQEPIVAQGIVEGLITTEKQGNGGFGYDPVFYYPPFGCTLAEVDAVRKNAISHRGMALQRFAAMLVERQAKNN